MQEMTIIKFLKELLKPYLKYIMMYCFPLNVIMGHNLTSTKTFKREKAPNMVYFRYFNLIGQLRVFFKSIFKKTS